MLNRLKKIFIYLLNFFIKLKDFINSFFICRHKVIRVLITLYFFIFLIFFFILFLFLFSELYINFLHYYLGEFKFILFDNIYYCLYHIVFFIVILFLIVLFIIHLIDLYYFSFRYKNAFELTNEQLLKSYVKFFFIFIDSLYFFLVFMLFYIFLFILYIEYNFLRCIYLLEVPSILEYIYKSNQFESLVYTPYLIFVPGTNFVSCFYVSGDILSLIDCIYFNDIIIIIFKYLIFFKIFFYFLFIFIFFIILLKYFFLKFLKYFIIKLIYFVYNWSYYFILSFFSFFIFSLNISFLFYFILFFYECIFFFIKWVDIANKTELIIFDIYSFI